MSRGEEGGTLEFRLLGTFEVAAGERVLEIGSPKQRALLAMLVLQVNRVVPLDTLVEELWGERLPASASASVQSLVFRLRRGLSDLAPDGGACLRSREPGYVLEADPARIDAHRFERLFAAGQDALARGDPQAAADLLREGLDLWRGAALADLSDRSFAQLEAGRLEEARLAAVEELVEAELALGRLTQALVRLEPHVAEHPLRERAWGQLMVALYRLGRQADALRAYQRIRRILGDELGVEPTPWLRQLEEQILQQRPELEGRSPPEPARATEGRAVETQRPGDTVVFLFTDIEASTRRWEGDQKAMAEDLARHDELVRAAIERSGGRVFAHTGDGVCAAFSTASRALGAAVDTQRALLGETWNSPLPLQVRMAVHAGAAEPRGDNYVGPTLNRTARLLSLGFGGQVLCSQAVADLVRDDVPADVSLVDLGEHELTDLARPERVFQVVHPELRSTFPPLRSPSRRRHNLPAILTSFVGRASELEEVRGLVAQSRLVTLTGMGGSGKTRLALEAATRAFDAFPDGIWIIELGALRDPALLPSTAAAVLGLATTGLGATPDALVDRLCEYLQPRRVLLVLDNCEHLVETVAGLAHAVLAACPDVTILATSREILGLAGEVTWRVPPLSLPRSEDDLEASDAVALFCERARAAQPGFALNPANAAAVAQVCHRLDGIPLALELAAARIRVLGAQELARRLDQRFRLLTGGDRAAMPRHQTLQAAMDWSYDLLPPVEQAVLRRLAVFPASFDLDAAEAVMGAGLDSAQPADLDALDLLSRLVDKSLVAVDSQAVEVRFRLLETVREYAAGKLAEAGETQAARRRHLDYFLALASTHEDPADPTRKWSTGNWIARAAADHDNFRAALEWSSAQGEQESTVRLAAALWRYWWMAHPLEGCDWLERALAGLAPTTPERLEAQIGLGFLLPRSGRVAAQRGEELLCDVLQLAIDAGQNMAAARARYFLGELAMSRGDPQAAEPLLHDALAAFNAMGAPFSAAWCHHALGWCALAGGDRGRARDHFEHILALTRQQGPADFLQLHAAAGLAPLAALDGETDRAASLAADAVAVAGHLPARGLLVMALTRASETAFLSGCQPRDTLVQLLRLLLDLGVRAWVIEVLEIAALVCEADGRPGPAVRLLGVCQAIGEALGDRPEGRVLWSAVTTCRHRLAATLEPDRLAEEDAAGRRMSLREALAWALEELGAQEAPAGAGRVSPSF